MFHVQMLTLIFVRVRMSANDALGRCDAVAMATVMEIAVLSTGAEHGVIIVEWGGWGGVNVTPTVTDPVPDPSSQSERPTRYAFKELISLSALVQVHYTTSVYGEIIECRSTSARFSELRRVRRVCVMDAARA